MVLENVEHLQIDRQTDSVRPLLSVAGNTQKVLRSASLLALGN